MANARLKYQIADLIQEAFPYMSPRILETAVKMCMGKTDRQIANELGVKYDTAKKYVNVVLQKTESRNRTEFVSKVLFHVLQKSA